MRRTHRSPALRLLLPAVALMLATAAPGLSSPSAADSGEARQTTDVRYGPITLPPAVGDHPGVFSAVVPAMPMPCTDCYVTGVEVDVVFSDGRSANLDRGVMLHHMVVFNSGRPDTTCPPETGVGALGERFFAAGNERTGGDLPAGFGYHLGTDPVRGAIEIMNHGAAPQVVFLVTKVSYVADSTPGMHPVRPVWLDVMNCATSEYDVPAGPSNRVWRWTSTLTGRVIAAGGHVHDWGTRIVVFNDTTGEQLCTSYAGYGTDPAFAGSIESMSTCIWDRLGTVRAGEALAIDAHYDPPEPQSGAMGIVLAYIYETDDLTGGTPPPPGVQASPSPPGEDRPPAHRHHQHHH